MDNLSHALVHLLNIRYPYEIQLRSKTCKTATAEYWALYKNGGSGILHRHIIRIYLGNLKYAGERSFETLIAHEFIHAWQEEQGYLDNHGESFQYIADRLSRHLCLPGIYNPKIDVT